MQQQKVVILGAGGFVGRLLTSYLAASGQFETRACLHRGGAWAVDATDSLALHRVLTGADAVVNCVAGRAEDIVASAHALAAVLQQQGRDGPRLIHFSSMAAYGKVTGDIGEDTPLLGDLNEYGKAKVEAEQILGRTTGAVMLRPGCIYGPGAPLWSLLIAKLLHAHRLGDLGTAARACSNLVHVDDVVQAVMAVLQRPRPSVAQAFNLAMRDAPDWNTYFGLYATALGAVPLASISRRRLALERWLIGPVLKGLEVLLPGRWSEQLPPRLPQALLQLWQQDIRLDSSRAERLLGLTWRPLKPALIDMVNAGDGG